MVERTQLIEALGDMRWGRHVAHFCEAKDDVLDALVPYFKAGLENNESCLCTVDEPLSAEEIRRVLGREVRNLDRYEADGRLELVPGREFYLKDGIFDQHDVLSAWAQRLNRAFARGCKGMRGAGSAFWLERKDFESFCDYENQLNDWISTQPMTMLCTHFLPSKSAAELLDLVSTHQCSITTRDRELAVIDSHGADRERDRVEGLLRQANQRVEIILDSITENFFSFSKDWRYTYLNKHAAEQVKILGKDPASLIGKVLWEEFPEVPNEQAFRRVMLERVAIIDELFYPPLGEWVENHIYPGADGGLVTFQRYITGRKMAEEKLRRSEAYLADGQKMSHTGSWAWNASTGDLFWSLEHYRICGVDPESFKLTIESGQQFIHPDDRYATNQSFERTMHEKSDFDQDLRIVRPDGTIRYVHSFGRPVCSESGDLTEYVGTIIDVTERKLTEEALHKAQSELAHLNRVATVGELTTSIAHELSQPLAAISANGGACLHWLDREVPDLNEARMAVSAMVTNAMRASDMIKHIRALVRKNDAQKELLNVNDLIREVIAFTANELTRNRVVIRIDFQPDVPPVMGDRVQLQQVLLNLILNGNDAMSAVEEPARELTIRSRQPEPRKVTVAVQDTGTGLGPDDPERLFDLFFSSKQGGLGLGLAISRRIVEAHGGRLWATPNEGPGATFQFSLPII